MQNCRLEPTGLGNPGKTHWLMGTGSGLARQKSASWGIELVWNETDPFLLSKLGPLAGYLEPLVTLSGCFQKSHLLAIPSCHMNSL